MSAPPSPTWSASHRGALVLVNDDDLTYCKARLDPESLRTAIDGIADVTESLPRTLLWSAVWEMTRDALMRARDFITLAVRGLATEDQVGVLQRVLAQLQVAVGSYAEPGWAAETGWPAVSGALNDLALSAEPGSDTQLAAVQALGRRPAATRAAGADRGVAGRERAVGRPDRGHRPVVDAAGRAGRPRRGGPADIDAAAAADPTASGERRATQLRALIPDPANKAAVWERVIGDDGMANALQSAAIAGFAHPAQARVAGAVHRAVLRRGRRRLGATGPIEVGKRIAVGLYPRWAVDQSTVDAAVAWDGDEHPPALRRLVSEGRAGTERALRAGRRRGALTPESADGAAPAAPGTGDGRRSGRSRAIGAAGAGYQVERSGRVPAWSARIRTPVTNAPLMSPSVQDATTASTANFAARSLTRRFASAPVTTSTDPLSGRERQQHRGRRVLVEPGQQAVRGSWRGCRPGHPERPRTEGR